MPLVQLRVIGGQKFTLTLPSKITIGQLQELVRNTTGKDGLILVLHGKHLHCEKSVVELSDGDSILGMTPRQPPPNYISGISDPDERLDEDIHFKLPPNASKQVRDIALFLQNRVHVPDILLVWLFAIKPRTWVLFFMWILLAPVAARYELGPIYIVGTLFALMFLNLGKRKHGESSAYSWFNEGFRQLPGQLNAEALDQQLRRGNL